jgi:hypothetical protein
MVVAVVTTVERPEWIPEPPAVSRLSHAAAPRPPTSLLRMHCALIV